MATTQDLINKLDKFETELKAAMPAISKEMAGVALSYTLLMIRRNGGILTNERYSDNPGVPAYLYRGKNKDYPRALNAAGRAYIDSKIKEGNSYNAKKGVTTGGSRFNPYLKAGYVNWKGLRQAQGLEIDKVDLTYSGRMLQNLGVIDTRLIGTLYQSTVGGTDSETRNKLKWNKARYGDFLKYPPEALALARKRADERINDLYKQIVLS